MRPNCLNCAEVLYPRDKYCGRCGQKTDIDRICIKELTREFLNTILHIEQGLIRLFKGLLTNPGKTAAEFVEGKRKTYFNPFTFMAVCVTITILAHNVWDPYINYTAPGQEVFEGKTETERADLLATNERLAELQKFSAKNMNWLEVAICPWFAFGLWLFYRKRKRNVAEITIAYLLFTAFGLMLFAVLISIPMHYLKGSWAYNPVFYTGLLLQALYAAWGLKGFFGLQTTWDYLKILGALAVIALIGFIPLTIFVTWFIYFR